MGPQSALWLGLSLLQCCVFRATNFAKWRHDWAVDCCTAPAPKCTGQVLSNDGEEHSCYAAKVACAAKPDEACHAVFARGTECIAVTCEQRVSSGSRGECIHTPMLTNGSYLPLFGAVTTFEHSRRSCNGDKQCLFAKRRQFCDSHLSRATAAGISPDQVEFVGGVDDARVCQLRDPRWRRRETSFAPVPSWECRGAPKEGNAQRYCVAKRLEWCREQVNVLVVQGLIRPDRARRGSTSHTGASVTFDSDDDRFFCFSKVARWRDYGLVPFPPIPAWQPPAKCVELRASATENNPTCNAHAQYEQRVSYCRAMLAEAEARIRSLPNRLHGENRNQIASLAKPQFVSADDQSFCFNVERRWRMMGVSDSPVFLTHMRPRQCIMGYASQALVGYSQAPTPQRAHGVGAAPRASAEEAAKKQRRDAEAKLVDAAMQPAVFASGSCVALVADEIEPIGDASEPRRCTSHSGDQGALDVPLYWINLERNRHRAERMRRQLARLRVRAHTRVPAVSILEAQRMMRSGQVLLQGVSKMAPLSTTNDMLDVVRQQTFTQIACTLSHLRAMSLASSEVDSHVLILEDDIDFEHVPRWGLSLMQLIDLAPAASSIIQLHTINPAVLGDTTNATCEPVSFLPWRDHHWSTSAYLVSKRGMERILSSACYGEPTVLQAPLAADRLLFRNSLTPVTVGRPLLTTKGTSTVQAGVNAKDKETLDNSINGAASAFYSRNGRCGSPPSCGPTTVLSLASIGPRSSSAVYVIIVATMRPGFPDRLLANVKALLLALENLSVGVYMLDGDSPSWGKLQLQVRAMLPHTVFLAADRRASKIASSAEPIFHPKLIGQHRLFMALEEQAASLAELVFTLDADIRLDRQIADFFHTVEATSPRPLISQPLIQTLAGSARQYYPLLNLDFWSACLPRVDLKRMAVFETQYLEQQATLLDAGFFRWFAAEVGKQLTDLQYIRGNDWGTDEIWCGAARSYRRMQRAENAGEVPKKLTKKEAKEANACMAITTASVLHENSATIVQGNRFLMAGQQVHQDVASIWPIWFRPVIDLRQDLHTLLKDVNFNISNADMSGRLMLRGAAAALWPNASTEGVSASCRNWWTTMCHRSYC